MVPSQNPVFLSSTNGRVVGVPVPGRASSVAALPQPTPPGLPVGSNQPVSSSHVSGTRR
jgi:hypothetical protein